MTQLPPVAPLPPSLPEPISPQKPGYVQAIAIMCLVDGILNIVLGGGLSVILFCGIFTACCCPIGLYSIVLGILEIVYATQILPDPIRADRPAKYIAVMQIRRHCPECDKEYDAPLLGLNFGPTRYERCPHCQHWHWTHGQNA